MDDSGLTEAEAALLHSTYNQMLTSDEIGPEVLTLNDQADLCQRLRVLRMNVITAKNATSELWLQFMTMFEIVMNYIRSDRLGDFNSQLFYLEKMLPFFAATGHNRVADAEQFKIQLTNYLFTIPDRPPVAGYTCQNSNSLLDWDKDKSGWSDNAMAH